MGDRWRLTQLSALTMWLSRRRHLTLRPFPRHTRIPLPPFFIFVNLHGDACRSSADGLEQLGLLWHVIRGNLDLLNSRDLLDAHGASTNNRELLRDGGLVPWAADSTASDDRCVAAFNTGTAVLSRTLPLVDPGLPGPGASRCGAQPFPTLPIWTGWSGAAMRPGAGATP